MLAEGIACRKTGRKGEQRTKNGKAKTSTSCKKEILKTNVNMFNVNDSASMFSIKRHQ